MEWLAELMGWKEGFHDAIGKVWVRGDKYVIPGDFRPVEDEDWDFWMGEVEPRIHERGLWEEYVEKIWQIISGYTWFVSKVETPYEVMQATLEQRAEALKRVLEVNDEMAR